MMALLQRQRSLYGAICRLLEVAGMTAEAMILGRPLFEESVFLDFVSRAPETVRYGHTLHYESDGLKRARHAFEALKREHPEDGAELDQVTAAVEQQRGAIQRLAERRGYRLQFSGDTEFMAKKLGRTEDLLAYEWANQFVHGRTFALRARLERSGEGVLMHWTLDPDGVGLLPLVVTWSTRSLLIAFAAVARMLDWAVPDSLTQVLDDVAELQHRMNDPDPSHH